MNPHSSPRQSRKKVAKDDVSYLFDSAKFFGKQDPTGRIATVVTNMKGWERLIEFPVEKATRKVHYSVAQENTLSDLNTAFDKVLLAIKTDPEDREKVIGQVPESIIPQSFHIKSSHPLLGDEALSLREDEHVFLSLSRDFPSRKPSGRWEVLQLARVFDELGLNQVICLNLGEGKDYMESLRGANRAEMKSCLMTRWSSLYVVLTEITRQSWVHCIERGVLLWCLTHSLDNLFKTAVDRCRIWEDICFHKETQISEKDVQIASLIKEKDYISRLLEKVTNEIEGYKSKRDYFYSKMQEAEEKEQLNRVETIEAKKRSEELVTEVNRLKSDVIETGIKQTHIEDVVHNLKEENALLEFRLNKCTCDKDNQKPPVITKHSGTQTDIIEYSYPPIIDEKETIAEEPDESDRSMGEEQQEVASEESFQFDLPDTLFVNFNAGYTSSQIKLFRSTYEKPDVPDASYLDPEILSITRDSTVEVLSSPQEVSAGSANDQETRADTALVDLLNGVKETKSTEDLDKEREFVWCHIIIVDRNNPSQVYFENIFAAPETQLEVLRILNDIKPQFFVPGMDRLLIGTFQLFSVKSKFFIQRLLMELQFIPDFLHAFLVRNLESGSDRTKRFYSFIAVQDHPLAEGWTSNMKVVLLKDPDTDMYAPVNLLSMEALSIKSLCKRLALKSDQCQLEFKVRAFMASKRDQLYRTFMGVGHQEYAKIDPSDFMNFVQSIRFESILKSKCSASDSSRRKSSFVNLVYSIFNTADSTRDMDNEASGRFDNRLEFCEFQTSIVFLAFEGFLKGDYSRLSSYSLVEACRKVIENHIERYTKCAERFLCYAVEALTKSPVQKIINSHSRILEKVFATEGGTSQKMTILQFVEVVKRFRDIGGREVATSNKAAAFVALNSIYEGSNKIPDLPTLNRSQFLLALCQICVGAKGVQFPDLKNNPEVLQWHMEELMNQLEMVQWGTVKEP